MSTRRVLVLGGYGVFGARLCAGLIADDAFEVLVAGRSHAAAQAFCARHGGVPVALDRAAPDLAARLAGWAPEVVVDAAGPFQGGGGDLVQAALACGAHYIDLSDDAEFSAAIARFDTEARARGLAAISGASSVPGISSAAVEALAGGLARIDRIDTVILPGNRAPRGLSVVRAILAQAGRPMRVWREGGWQSRHGWSGPRREVLAVPDAPVLRGRWSARIGAPDLLLFPARYGVRHVGFRAGLELRLLHFGLWALALPVRAGLVRSLAPAAPAMRRIAALFERFGSDRGGMRVVVRGDGPDGVAETRVWTLIAEAGDGPQIPVFAARILCRRIAAGTLAPGARPCLGEVTLAELEAVASDFAIRAGRRDSRDPPLFPAVLGPGFATLPPPVQALHRFGCHAHWRGRARVDRGRSWLARLVCALVGFPPASEDIAVEVTMTRDGGAELWRRRFGTRAFRSELRAAGPPGSGRITERFGPMVFEIALTPRGDPGAGALDYPVTRGWFLGIPLPRALLPRSESSETAEDGAARFDVGISLPLAGPVVRYRGWLRRVEDA